MKKIIVVIACGALLSSPGFATEKSKSARKPASASSVSIQDTGDKTLIYISGSAASVLYTKLQIEPGKDNSTGSDVKIGINMKCVDSGDETTCVIALKDSGKSGEASLHGQ